MAKKQVCGHVIVINNPSSQDEQADGTLDALADAVTKAILRFDSDGKVERHTVSSLLEGVNLGLRLAVETVGDIDVVGYAYDGDTTDVDKHAVEAKLSELDGETAVVLAIGSNQPENIDRGWLDELDDDHPKATQIDVIYPDENIAEVFGREVVPFLASVA